jgi:uncharacterized surface anchored protein
MRKQDIYFCIVMVAMLIFLGACKKPPGPGGRATVKGKVYAYDYDNTQNYLISKGYSAGTKVFIVYGDDKVVGNNVTTSYDGSFEFKYLNKGKYRVFVNSVDTGYKVKGNDTEIPVSKEFEIKDAKGTITLEDFVINK